ncbi:MAG TPA: transcriptional regulator GcvA [Steroidobacteraceae bacterium]|nr:transcriptional regulator GcvA [Steroidobacteraceae bacterium]
MARRLPPLNALRAFEASARLGSFVAAAHELRVSAAAVSQQVRRLEEYLDTRLFQRLARGLALTDQGRDYLPELSAGFDLLGESTARVRAKRADGVLTLTTLASFANGWLLPRLHRFRERAPRIDVVLRTSRHLMDFRRDAIDLAIRFAPGPGRGLHGELLCQEELFPVASPQLFRGGRIPDTLAALTEYPLLHDIDAGPEQPWLGWRGWFERAGLSTAEVGRGPQFSDSVVLISAAVAGLGIAIGRAPQVGPLLARGQLVRVTPATWMSPWSYYLMAPPAHFKRPVVRTFVDWMLAEARATDSAAG